MCRCLADYGVLPERVVDKKNCTVMCMICTFFGFVCEQAKRSSYSCDNGVILTCHNYDVKPDLNHLLVIVLC